MQIYLLMLILDILYKYVKLLNFYLIFPQFCSKRYIYKCLINWEIIMFTGVYQNRFSNQKSFSSITPPPLLNHSFDFGNDLLEGFINHPERFPLQYRRLRFWEKAKIEKRELSNIGLTFFSEQYQKPGSLLEITIPTRKESHIFLGRVVAVKESDNGFEIGTWLVNAEDAPKLRIVEQICHIELYLNDKKYKDGPFLSPEKLTEEWISRFASSFPTG